MTEYDFSPEAYEQHIQTQNRVANWVQHTEQHRLTFEAAAPGAPGLPPALRPQSPPILQALPRLSHAYPKPSVYRRVPPSSSSSKDSYVHVVPPQIRRCRPPPPPIYAPPVPPRSPFPVQPYPSPVGVRVYGDHLSPPPSGRQHRSKSHSYSHPPLLIPIYTSPPAPSHASPPPIIYMSSQGYPTPSNIRPIKPPREQYLEPPSLRILKTSRYDQPLTPPTSSSASTSLGNPPSLHIVDRPLSTSRQENDFLPSPSPDDLRQPHRQHQSTNTLSGLEPPYISRHFLRQHSAHHSHHCDCHDCSRRHHHPYVDQNRRHIKSRSQSIFQTQHTFPPQVSTHRDYSHGRLLNSVNSITSGAVGISVPPRYPIDDRALV